MDKVISLCQLAIRSRKVAIGSQLIPSIQKQSACIVLYSSDCGDNRKKKLKDKCTFYNVPVYEIDPLVFNQITNDPIQSLAILDKGFAQAIINKMKG